MTSWVLLAICVTALVALVQGAGRGWGGPVTLVAAYLGLQLVARPLMLLTGLDTPSLPDPNATRSTADLIEGALAIAAVWIVAVAVGAQLRFRSRLTRWEGAGLLAAYLATMPLLAGG